MKRREAMLMVRGISETILRVVMQQGKGKETYTLSHEEVAKISADALDVANYLVMPRSE